MNFGQRLKELRKAKKITQQELGDIIHVSKVSISGYETGNRSPDSTTLNAIADYFGVSLDYLQGRTDNDQELYKLSEKETKDIAIEVQNMLEGMNTDAEVNFYGEPMSDDDKELLAAALETALQVSKRAAKKKFTRNDYKDKKSGG